MTDTDSRSVLTSALLLASCYIAAQMLSDIGSLKIASLFGWAVDGGTFIYPITFTLRDLIHKRLGKKAARQVIFLAAGINLFMATYFWLVGLVPADTAWNQWDGARVGMNDAFVRLLSPAWTIVLASIAAEVLSELIDTEVYQLWTTRVTARFQWSRVLVSNAASIPVDSLVFCWLAFGWGLGLPASAVWEIFWLNVILKFAVTLVSLPAIYLTRAGGKST
ncbi:MAG TPA: queuosine precursor transporter [Spirochaetales bacterium]|nr:queuosine precursor transporter [Spirochaetales bacterium]